jgi:SAM-dependent methyltransferase
MLLIPDAKDRDGPSGTTNGGPMNTLLRGMVRAVAETFDLPGPILEVGSYQVEDQEDIADLRSLFPGRPYVGLDMRPGQGVDLVGEVEALPQADASVGTVVALETFEHVRRFWKGFEEVRRVLRPDGALLVAAPFHFHIHSHPYDYWRFTPDAYRLLLEDYPSKIIGWHGPTSRPANVWCLAFREERPAITAAQFDRYQMLLKQYARMPLPWTRRLRYNVGRVLFGRRIFAPWLDREKCQSECLNRAAKGVCHAFAAHGVAAETRRDPASARRREAGRFGVHRQLELPKIA